MKNYTLFILFISTLLISPVFGQRKTKLNTNAQGTLFAQIGMNRSLYSNTDVVLKDDYYDLTLSNTSVHDNAEGKGLSDFFQMESPQINLKLGYFFKPKWAITIGFDRYNTFFESNQTVNVSGTIAPQTNSEYSGEINEDIELNGDNFDIAQAQGINFISIGIQRNDLLTRTRKSEFAIHSLYGVQIGPLISNVDYTYDYTTMDHIRSVGGFGVAANLGIRFEFFQHIYLQLEVDGGILNQKRIDLSANGSAQGQQVHGFFSPSLHLGFNVFARPKNGCNTCPKW